MAIVTRYVWLELLKTFGAALCALTLMMLLVGVVREAREQGLEPIHVVRIVPFILPDALRFAVPGTILLAVCTVYGRMAGSNEVVALKSMGISPWVALTPALVLGFALSLATVWLNDVAVSWGRQGMRQVVIASVEEIVYSVLRNQRCYTSKNISIVVKGIDGRRLVQPTISLQGRGKTPSVTLIAAEAELRGDPERNLLTVVCTNGTLEAEGQERLRFADTIEWSIPLDRASTAGADIRNPSSMALAEIPEELMRRTQALEEHRQECAAEAAFQLLSGDLRALAGDEWRLNRGLIDEMQSAVYRLETEPHRRWSNGFSCLCFVLVGAPTAIRLRHADFLTSFFACFLPILVVYYPLLAFGVDQAKSGTLPPYAVWIGNVILAGAGYVQLRHVLRY